jgi:hypothetical protein
MGDYERTSEARRSRTRRRTPGLRREEVAQLCGLSATWYTLPQKLVTENYRGWSMYLSHRR